jgi:hypothetical protein
VIHKQISIKLLITIVRKKMNINIKTIRQALNPAYLKQKVGRAEIEPFKKENPLIKIAHFPKVENLN